MCTEYILVVEHYVFIVIITGVRMYVYVTGFAKRGLIRMCKCKYLEILI